MAIKVLLVEDHAETRELVRLFLRGTDYELNDVDSFEAAVESLTKIQPDIVLLNVVLPDGPGLTLLSLIKSQWPRIKVIMFTGSEKVNDIFRAGQLGAFAYFQKPFDPQKLLEVLNNAVNHKEPSHKKIRPHESKITLSETSDLNFNSLESVERNAIIQMLKKTNGNKLETAKRLKIGRQTLYNKIKAYDIEA